MEAPLTGALVVDVDAVVGHPGASREISGTHGVSLHLGHVAVDGPMTVTGVVRGTVDGVLADFRTTSLARLTCVRCLVEWEERVEAGGTQHFARTPDEDGYGIVDRTVDIAGPAIDELALSLPSAPLCRQDCKGLCPICGTDLNSAPCAGHEDDSDSPFTALKDLLDP